MGYEREIDYVGDIAHEAYRQVEMDYGYTFWSVTDKVRKQHLAYHNVTHTRAVVDRVIDTAKALEMSALETAVAVVAAAAHDVIHEGDNGAAEQASADWLERRMSLYECKQPQIQAARLAILGTQPIIEHGRMTGQRVTQMEFPDAASERIARVVAVADLGGLYLSTGPLDSHNLYAEQRLVHHQETKPSMEALPAWQENMVALAEDFRFAHPIGETLFAGLRARVVGHHTRLLERIRKGEFPHLDAVKWEDMSFRDDHR